MTSGGNLWISVYNTANIFKNKLFSGEQICIAQGVYHAK